jgi:flavocytochrome c
MKSTAKDDPPWEDESDVVVIGSGLAGLAAAVEAAQAGCSVVVLEKMKACGGNSSISDGVMAAAGTAMQKNAGIEDSPDTMYGDMMKAGEGLNQPGLVRIVVQNAEDAFIWTRDYLGVKYLDRVDQFGGHSVPRCYTTDKRSGSAIIKQMLAKLGVLGIRLKTSTQLQTILTDDEGRVCGVQVREGYAYSRKDSGRMMAIKARRGVVLATGGFANDIPFRTAQDPRLDKRIGSTNKFSTTSEGLREAMRIGALPVHLSRIQLGPWTSPDEKGYGIGPDFGSYIAFPFGIVVNPATGRRMVNELADRKTRADAIMATGNPCIGIADQQGIQRSGRTIDHCLKKAIVKVFSSLEEIADQYSIPWEPFRNTVERFNRSVSNRHDDEWGKPIVEGTAPLDSPPFYCMRMWPKIHHTMGGILINAKAQVLDLSKRPLPGLYAAGEVTGGIHGACRLGSCAITECLVFGRIAGQQAASQGGPP